MLKIPNTHYIDVKSNEQQQQDITVLTSLKVSGTSQTCLIVICSILDVTYCIKNIMTKWLLSQSRKVTSVFSKGVDCTDNVQEIFWRENDKCLLFTMGWSGRLLFFFLCSRSSQEMLSLQWSDADWGSCSPWSRAFITSIYKWRF